MQQTPAAYVLASRAMGNDIARLWQHAEKQMAQRNGDAAHAAYEAIVALDPRHAPAWLRLSHLASFRGRYREAVTAALSAAAVATTDLLLRADICERLIDVGEFEVALDYYRATKLGDGAPAQMVADFALLLQKLDDPPLALQLAEAAWAKGLRSPQLRYLRATLKIFCGQNDGVEQELEAVLQQAPQFASAHWTLSKLRAWSPQHNHIERLQRAVSAKAQDDPAAPYLFFALFKELEDVGRYPEAWQALADGCAARRRALRYDRAAEHALFGQLVARCTPEFLSQQAQPSAGPVPLFIVGMPRSGTTVLERILGAHSQVADAGELNDFPYQMLWAFDRQSRQVPDEQMIAQADGIDYAELGRRYLAHTQWRARGRPFYTDKLPRNFMQVGFIHRALPQAKILHMVRDPMDTCFSNLKELFGAAYPHSYDQQEMAGHFRDYQRLMDHWRHALPGRVHDVSYEALVADPERVAKELLAFCGLPWEPGCVAIEQRTSAVSTASVVQVREPIHQRSLGQWKRYEQQLQPLRRLLEV